MNRKSMLLAILVVLILILIIQLAARDNGPIDEVIDEEVTEETEETVDDETSATTAPATTAAPKAAATPDPKKVYEDALARYGNQRIQFDAACQANPRTMTLNNGAGIMLDNRSGDARWISFDGVGYNVPGFGWKAITATAGSHPLPHTIKINCGSAVNVGSILVQ